VSRKTGWFDRLLGLDPAFAARSRFAGKPFPLGNPGDGVRPDLPGQKRGRVVFGTNLPFHHPPLKCFARNPSISTSSGQAWNLSQTSKQHKTTEKQSQRQARRLSYGMDSVWMCRWHKRVAGMIPFELELQTEICGFVFREIPIDSLKCKRELLLIFGQSRHHHNWRWLCFCRQQWRCSARLLCDNIFSILED
jgi:hypothetical protein